MKITTKSMETMTAEDVIARLKHFDDESRRLNEAICRFMSEIREGLDKDDEVV